MSAPHIGSGDAGTSPIAGDSLSPSAVRIRTQLRQLNDRKAPRTRAGRLLIGVILGVPIAALLGVAEWIWPFLVLPLAFHLLSGRSLYAPRALFIWLGFVALAIVSVVSAGDGFIPIATYAAATVAFLFAFNLPEDELPDRMIVRAVAVFWIVVAASGLVGVFTGTTEFPSVGATVIGPADESDLANLMEVTFAVPLKEGEPAGFTDFVSHRPSGILPFANHWGSAIVMFLGAAVVFRYELRGTRASLWFHVLAFATLVPFVLSRNRWAWLTLPVIFAYLIIRYWRPNPKLARSLLAALLVLAVVAIATPLRSVVTDRFEDESGNRPDQYELSMELVADAPLLGYGTIQLGENEVGQVRELGADSQILFGLVSYGYPATIVLFGWLILVAVVSRRINTPISLVTHLAVLVMLLQSPFYVFLPHRVVLLMLLAGALYRQVYTAQSFGRRPVLLLARGR